MNTYTLSALPVLLLAATLAGCVTTPATSVDQTFASGAVLKEINETRPAFAALPANEQAEVYNWLLANCALGAGERRTQFVELGNRGELALIEAFRMGPPVALLAELADWRRADFAAIQEQLAGEDGKLFDTSVKERVKAIPENSYVADGIDQTILSYQLAALDGLTVVGTSTSIAWLERTSSKLENPELKRAALRTLEVLRGRGIASNP